MPCVAWLYHPRPPHHLRRLNPYQLHFLRRVPVHRHLCGGAAGAAGSQSGLAQANQGPHPPSPHLLRHLRLPGGAARVGGAGVGRLQPGHHHQRPPSLRRFYRVEKPTGLAEQIYQSH